MAIFGNKKKKKKTNWLVLGMAGAITAYMGSQINQISKRYKVEEDTISCGLFRLEHVKNTETINSPNQPSYKFNIYRNDDNSNVGDGILYFGQESNSYYGGHIVINSSINGLNDIVTPYLIALAKKHLMSHLYFICDIDDEKSSLKFEALGAKYTKDITIPENHARYNPKDAVCEQYKLTL